MVPHGPFARPAAPKAESIEEVWFRRAHCDITGGSGACWPVANITLDLMLDGAVEAGAICPCRQSIRRSVALGARCARNALNNGPTPG